jgi:hypothetical protein
MMQIVMTTGLLMGIMCLVLLIEATYKRLEVRAAPPSTPKMAVRSSGRS